jgi:hypothetical protein
MTCIYAYAYVLLVCRWERLYDGRARKYVTVNIDSLEVGRHTSAIECHMNRHVSLFASKRITKPCAYFCPYPKLLPEGFCICETCDNLLSPGDPKCFECLAERSERNKKLAVEHAINAITHGADVLGNSTTREVGDGNCGFISSSAVPWTPPDDT